MSHKFVKALMLETQDECSICYDDFLAPCKLARLECNSGHIFHVDCLEGWIEQNKGKHRPATCPMCRIPIEESKIEKFDYMGI